MEPNLYEEHMIQLEKMDAIFSDFTQLYNSPDVLNKYPYNEFLGVDPDIYDKKSSLLFGATSEKYVEFHNSWPLYLTYYKIIIAVGCSKNPNDNAGVAPVNEHGMIYSECIFQMDYFRTSPVNTSIIGKPTMEVLVAPVSLPVPNIKSFMHPKLKFCKMPYITIRHIEKITNLIDCNDNECLQDVIKFLENDKKKVMCLQNNIDNTDKKIKEVVEKLEAEKKFNENILAGLLSTRGGSIESYNKMIKHFNDKNEKKIDNIDFDIIHNKMIDEHGDQHKKVNMMIAEHNRRRIEKLHEKI